VQPGAGRATALPQHKHAMSPHMTERRWLHVTMNTNALAQWIVTHRPRFLTVKETTPRPDLLAEDGEPAASHAYLHSVKFQGGEPFAEARVHVDHAVYERSGETFRSRPALAVLVELERGNIDHAQPTILAAAPVRKRAIP
jgi:hypothetical protein